MVSEKTRKYLPLLQRIGRLGDRAKKCLIAKADREFLDCVSECANNVIKGHIPLTASQLKRLRRRRHDIRTLALKKTSDRTKRRILQKGGFFSALIPPALTVLASLLFGNADG